MCAVFPLITTSPEVGESIVEITFKNVDFPLPDGPIMATNSLYPRVNLYFLKQYEGLSPHILLRRFYV